MDLQCEFIFPFDRSTTEAQNNTDISSKPKELTVGDVFYAACSTPEKITGTHFTLLTEPPAASDKYVLKLLSNENQDNKWVFKFTSYRVGKHQIPKIELTTEDSQKLNLGSLQIQVNSILNPQEKVEPFGPISGLTIPIPLLYWFLLVFVLCSFLVSLSTYFFFKWRRKKMLSRLEEYEIHTSPLQQFYSSYRKVQRENVFLYGKEEKLTVEAKKMVEIITEIEEALKLYLLRNFKTPALEKTWKSTIHDLSKYHHEFMNYQSQELKEIIKELDKAKKADLDKLRVKDLHQIFEKVRLFIEFSDNLNEALIKKDKAYLKKLKSLRI